MTREISNPLDFNKTYNEEIVIRRITWLMQEAKSDNPSYDLTTVSIMRTLSNYFTVGVLGNHSSASIKMRNMIMSKGAHNLLIQHKKSEWIKATVNEHPEPLKLFWAWICENCNSLSTYEIAMRFHQYPMVTITKEEDKLLSEAGFRSKGSPQSRYEAARIQVITISERPANIFNRNGQTDSLAACE